MAIGRMVLTGIAHDEALARVSAGAALLYLMCQPHLDVEGRMVGHPGLVRATVMPLREGVTDREVGEWLHELSEARNGRVPLVQWYEAEDENGVTRRYLSFPGFGASQPNLRPDREAASRCPPPPGVVDAQLDLLPGAVRQSPESLRTNSGPTPEDGRTLPPRSRSRSRSGSEEPHMGNGAVHEPDAAEFEAVWQAYPRRLGGNPKEPARVAYLARRREGISAEELMEGTKRYATFVQRTKRERTEFVLQAKTFFGPSQRWRDDFSAPVQPHGQGGAEHYDEAVNERATKKGRALDGEEP